MKKNDVRKRIIEVLKKHPEGLSISEIAKAVGIHRINVSKYIYQLIGSGVIYERKVGAAKLCYLKKNIKRNLKRLAILFIFLGSFIPIKAQEQSHPLSEIHPINTNLDMYQYNITNVSYIGIGLTTPAYPLDVSGSARITGDLTVSGTIYGDVQGAWTPTSDLNMQGYSIHNVNWFNGSSLNLTGNAYISGNVGIGTTSPVKKLDVVGDMNTTGTIYEGGTALSEKYVSRSDWTTIDNYPSGCPAGYAVQIIGDTLTCVSISAESNITGVGTANYLAKWTGADTLGTSLITDDGETVAVDTSDLYINTTSGNVGIGTTSPSAPLEVRGTNPVIKFGDSYSVGQLVAGSTYIAIGDNDGNNRLVILQSNGNVGIGIMDPDVKLEIYTGSGSGSIIDSDSNSGLRITDTNGAASTRKGISFYSSGPGSPGVLAAIEPTVIPGWDTHLDLINRQNGNLVVGLRLHESGNVGIGTTAPNARLEVQGSGTGGLSLNVTNDLFVNDTSGNVGIGTTAPDYELDVSGSARITGDLVVEGTTYSTQVINATQVNASIYYDADNNAYYLDPASTSVLNALSLTTLNGGTPIHSGNIGSYAVTSVTAGDGLTGGGGPGSVTLNVGQGTGIIVSADSIAVNETYLSENYIDEGQTAGGDLTGTYPNPTVAKIRGVSVSTTAPTSGQALVYDGTQYAPTGIVTDSDLVLDGNNRIYQISIAGTNRELRSSDVVCTDCVTLGTETTGDYVKNLTQGTGIVITGGVGEGSTPTVAIDTNVVPRKNADETITGKWTFDDDVQINKNLRVAGNITYVNADTIRVNGSIIPPIDDMFDVGNSTNRWKDGYFAGTVYASTFEGSISANNVEDVWVNESGDTMSGNLNMGGNDITNVGTVSATTLSGDLSCTGCVGNTEIDDSTQFVSVRNSGDIEQFSITDGSRGIQFAAGSGISVSFDAANHRVTYTNLGDTDATDDVTDSDLIEDANGRIYKINKGGTNKELNASDVGCTDCVDLGTETSGTLPLGEGGTGATTASGARSNLGASGIGDCPSGQVVMNLTTGAPECVAVDTNPNDDITGSGTANALAYWTGTSSIGNLSFGTSGQFLKSQGTGALPVWDTITLGTDTEGDYVQSISGNAPISISGGTGEGSTPIVSLNYDTNTLGVAGSNLYVLDIYVNASGDTMSGNLDMNGNLILNIGAAGTDFTSGGGLTLAGALTANGAVTLGDGDDDISINSDDWDISSAGAGTGFTSWIVDSIRIGYSGTNEIDTSSGNLILDSTGGTVEVDDNLDVNGVIYAGTGNTQITNSDGTLRGAALDTDYEEDSAIECGTTNAVIKRTGTDTYGCSGIVDASDATAITIDSSERVGIGDTTPDEKLDVSGGNIEINDGSATGTYKIKGLRQYYVGDETQVSSTNQTAPGTLVKQFTALFDSDYGIKPQALNVIARLWNSGTYTTYMNITVIGCSGASVLLQSTGTTKTLQEGSINVASCEGDYLVKIRIYTNGGTGYNDLIEFYEVW